MSWLGKMIGGTVGFVLGGPIGAVAGATFGHEFVDKKEDKYLSSRPGLDQSLSSQEQAQLIFFTAAFSMLAKISKADGQVSPKEISAVENFMEVDLQLDFNSRQTAQNIFRQAVNSPEPFDAFALQFFTIFNRQPRILELMMDVLLRVSTADGQISPNEEAMLLSAARIFQFSANDYEHLKSKYASRAKTHYAVLKCDETASDDEIKKQYRKLANEYHPDKVEGKGLPDEFIKLAKDKFIKIQEAYDAVKKERGF